LHCDKYGKVVLPGCGCSTISDTRTIIGNNGGNSGFNQDCDDCNNERVWIAHHDARYFKHTPRMYDYQGEELRYVPDGVMNGSCFYIQTMPWFNPYGAELWEAEKEGYIPSDRAKRIELSHPPIEYYLNLPK
jgi:hypothetical protein